MLRQLGGHSLSHLVVVVPPVVQRAKLTCQIRRLCKSTIRIMTKMTSEDSQDRSDQPASADTANCQNRTRIQSSQAVTTTSPSSTEVELADDEVNVSFAGCGFLAIYHLGVLKGLLRDDDDVISNVRRWGGASAGAIAAAAVVCLPNKLEECVHLLRDFADTIQNKPFGALTPGFNVLDYLRSELELYLPQNAHELAYQKLFISVTSVPDGKNELLTDFRTREELIEALLCSCYLPVYCGFRIPTFRGKKYIDGGMTGNMPMYPRGRTLCVSPFSGHLQDICPSDQSWLSLSYVVAGHSFRVCSQNVRRAMMALFPPSHKILDEFMDSGLKDTRSFMEEKGLLQLKKRTLGPKRRSLWSALW